MLHPCLGLPYHTSVERGGRWVIMDEDLASDFYDRLQLPPPPHPLGLHEDMWVFYLVSGVQL